ncbi:DinB family protein [Kitasatospora sp. NBC_01560]
MVRLPRPAPHIAGTAQHAGHADIVREALDGAKTMG